MAVTQEQNGSPKPVAFLSRYLSATERKWSPTERLVSFVAWGVRKLRRYTTTAKEIRVAVQEEAEVAVIIDK